MPFPAEAPFNPQVSKIPVLGSSSGNPKSFQDPNSVASVGSNIQAMADQAKADTLYDSPMPKKEGFRNMEGFQHIVIGVLIVAGITSVILSMAHGKKR